MSPEVALFGPDSSNWRCPFIGVKRTPQVLLRGATGGARGDLVQELIAIVRQVASGLPPEQSNARDDGFPGG